MELIENEIKEYLKDFIPKQWKSKVKQNQKYVDYLNKKYPDVLLKDQVICFMRNSSPYCIICNKPLVDIRKSTCSHECRIIHAKNIGLEGKNGTRLKKLKETLNEKYGVDNAQQIKGVAEKRLNSMVEKYGTKASPKNIEKFKDKNFHKKHKNKRITNLIDKYGVDNPSKLKTHKDKIRNALIKKYGQVDYKKNERYINEITKKLYDKSLELFKNSNITLLDITSGESYKDRTVSFKCNVCNNEEYNMQRATILVRMSNSNTPCSVCSGLKIGSHAQSEIYSFIKENIYMNILQNQNIPNSKLQMDIYIPELQLAFEYDGLYWHNELRHHKTYHKIKTELANNANITLIHIFEDEWIYQKDIVKSRILNLLHKSKEIIYARKCKIDKVNQKDQKEFLFKNHIQGYSLAHVAYGLYYNNELVSLMSFSKPSKAKGQQKEDNVYELLRFCNKVNTNVVGGASKLLKSFEKDFNPKKILSFADRRWSTGNLYYKLGFNFIKNTELNYWYFKPSDIIRYHRYKLRKNKDDNPSLTEYENRLNEGWLRIWDCGSMKFIKEY